MQRKLPGNTGPAEETQLQAALRRCRKGFVGVTLFSAMANILMLVAPVYMLQMYDRVLTSASYETLIVSDRGGDLPAGLLRHAGLGAPAPDGAHRPVPELRGAGRRAGRRVPRQPAALPAERQPARARPGHGAPVHLQPARDCFLRRPLGAGIHYRHFPDPPLAGHPGDIRRAVHPVPGPAHGVDLARAVPQRLGTHCGIPPFRREQPAPCGRAGGDGHVRGLPPPLARQARPRHRVPYPRGRPGEHAAGVVQGKPPDRAGGHPRPGRLAGAQAGDLAGHDDRRLHYPGPRAGAHRTGHLGLARLHVGAPVLAPAEQPAHQRPADPSRGRDQPAPAHGPAGSGRRGPRRRRARRY